MSEELEKKSRLRRIVLMVMASAFLTWQVPGMDLFNDIAGGNRSLPRLLSVAGFLAWAGMLVLLLATGRIMSKNGSGKTRAALEDELVRANRSKAFIVGYVVAVIVAAACFTVSLFLPLTGTDAAHLVLIAAVVAPMYAFAVLERVNA